MSDLEQIADFQLRFAKAQASEIIDLPWGFALLQREFPVSHDHNRVVVTSAAPSGRILSDLDGITQNAGLSHQCLSVSDDLADNLRADLLAAGFELETIAIMIFTGASPSQAPQHVVKAVSPELLRPELIREWQRELPDSDGIVYEQLADRIRLYDEGAEVARLVVMKGDRIAARADLFFDRVSGTSQLENVMTHPEFRGRGYATSLVNEALRRSDEAGKITPHFLAADRNDWPYHWYQRLGYVDSAHVHYFTRA